MENALPTARFTQHALLVAWGDFAHQIGLLQRFQQLTLHQKTYLHPPQGKILEFLVATLGGVEHLQDISREAHPLDQDVPLAQAWGQARWVDYSSVSRALRALRPAEAQQIVQALEAVSQPFLTREINLTLLAGEPVVYDGDLTGLPVSKASQSYPGVAFGHMDDQIRLGYQAAVVSLRSPTYGRLWLSVAHHPGNTVSASVLQEMIEAAEARTGLRPWRRTDLLAQRLEAERAEQQALGQTLAQRQEKVQQLGQACAQLGQQVQQAQQQVQEWEAVYQTQQRPERPTSRLAKARKQVDKWQRRRQRQEQALDKARQAVARTTALLAQQQEKQEGLQKRLERCQQENASNTCLVTAIFRLDAGFGTYENLALLIELGYEVYSKVQNHKVVQSVLRQVAAEEPWIPVGQDAAMVCWAGRKLESFCYAVDVGLQRFTSEGRVKYSALVHFGPRRVTEDAAGWFHFYQGRQMIEAGIRESKQVFQLHRLKVRAEAALWLQENLVLFAANFIRWGLAWLVRGQTPGEGGWKGDRLSVKAAVQVAAHTSAQVIGDAEGKLLRFSEQSVYAGQTARLPRFVCQLPLPLAQYCDFGPV